MIEIKYFEDSIRIETKNLSEVFSSNQLPLNFDFVRQVNSKILWGTKLNSFAWASFPDTEMVDVVITDNMGNHIHTHKWSCFENGTIIYQKLLNYCLLNKSKSVNNKGVVIGTHNGEFGEWVPVALNELSDILLIEASDKQYNELIKNHSRFNNLEFIQNLVTVDGESTKFYEGGKGYTNSVLKRVIEYWETEEITETTRESIKFSDLITSDVNWIHLDVEGIDDKLLYTLSDEQFSHVDLIVFEYNNLSTEERENINNFLISKGYYTFRDEGVSIAYK